MLHQNAKKGGLTPAHILLMLTLAVAFLQISNRYTFPLMAMWIALAAGKLVANIEPVRAKIPLVWLRKILEALGIQTENKRKLTGVVKTFLAWNFGSQVAVYLYTILLVVFEMTKAEYLSTNAMTFINGLSAASVLYLFGKRGVYVSFAAICVAWFISVIRAFVAPEFEDFWKNFELHDISFGAGYILLYYLFAHKQWNRLHMVCCAVVVLLIALAYKRIGIAALVLTVVVWAVLRLPKTEKVRRIILICGSVAAIFVCYLFVWTIVDGWLIETFEKLGINPMGRNHYFTTLAKHCKYAISFLGLGRNASATLFTTKYSYFLVGNVHSDILRMYAECGFVLFGLWLSVFWLILPRTIGKKYGYRSMEFFVLATVYTFIVYSTDNTELYLVNQYYYMLVCMHVVQEGNTEPVPLECKVLAAYETVGRKLKTRRKTSARKPVVHAQKEIMPDAVALKEKRPAVEFPEAKEAVADSGQTAEEKQREDHLDALLEQFLAEPDNKENGMRKASDKETAE